MKTESQPETSSPESSTKDVPEATKPNIPSVDKPTATPRAKPVVAHPKPTDEQLARWKHKTFDPLQLLAHRENSKTGFVLFAAATNDGKQYLLGGAKLTLWKIDGQEPEHEFFAANNDKEFLLSFALSPVGHWCAAGNAKGELRVFDIQERREVASKQTGANAVVKIAISPDGKEIATIAYVSEVTIWDAGTLEKKRSFKVDTREVKHLRYVGPQTLIAAGESMSTWDTASGDKIKTYPSERYQTAVALSPDGKELVFGAGEFLQRWNLADDRASGEYRGVPARNPAIRFTSDGTLVAVATGDAIRILDSATGQLLQVIDAAGSTVSDVSWFPETHMLLVGTDTGRNRIWGRPNEGEPFGLRPVGQPIVVATDNANQPSSVAENLAMMDLRLLPKLPDAKGASEAFHSINYTVPTSTEEVKAFYRHVLEQRGWTEPTDQATPYTIPFQKNGHTLTLSPYGEKPTESSVSVSYLGNYDIRKTPKLDEFVKSTVYEGDTSVIYKVAASLLHVETELLRKLHGAGWTAIVRLDRGNSETADGRDFEFVKNGTVLRIFVQRDREDESLYVVSYGKSLSLHSLPVPPDAGLMEWDDYLDTRMVANTSLSLEEATAFYETTMPKQGWTPRKIGRRVEKEVVYLPYYWGQRDVTIALEPLGDGLTRIRAGAYSRTSWQTPDETVTTKSKPDQESTPKEGIEAADFPILRAAKAPTYDKGANRIKITLEKVSLVELSQEYAKAMKDLGWTAKPFGDPQEDSVSIHFEKGSKTIYYQSSIDPLGVGSVDLSGNGLLWSKAIASKQLISYGAWLRNNKYPATLKRLDDYRKEMENLPVMRKSE